MRSLNVFQHFEIERVFFQLNEQKIILLHRYLQLKLGNISVMNSIERDCSTEIGLRFNSLWGNHLTSLCLSSRTSKARIITLVLLIDLTVVGSLKMNYVMVL